MKAEANDLQGAAEDIQAAGKYILAQPEGQPAGFYLAETGTIQAGKAYLDVPASEVKAYYFFGDGTTGIETVENGQAAEKTVIYNLAGQRIGKVQKGINIVNGKKILK